MLGCRRLASCRNLFKKLKILPLMSQYIFSITMFIVKNKHQFTVNSEIHNINTRRHSNLHQPAPNLTGLKQSIHYSGVKIYNNLPPQIKQRSNNLKTFEQKFKKISISSLVLFAGRILPNKKIDEQTTVRRKN
jgi:hypothetical protein